MWYRKVASSRLSQFVAHFHIFRLLMKGNFDAYVLWPLDKMVQNWIVDRSTARNFSVKPDFSGKTKTRWNMMLCCILGDIFLHFLSCLHTKKTHYCCRSRAFYLSTRARVSTGATGAWHPENFWTELSSTRWFWQFYYIILCFTLKIWEFTSDWHPLFQNCNSSPAYYETFRQIIAAIRLRKLFFIPFYRHWPSFLPWTKGQKLLFLGCVQLQVAS